MINLFRMDWHRFKTNKVMVVLLLVYCAFQIFGIFMMKQYEQTMSDSGIQISMMNESQFIQFSLSQPPFWTLIYIVVFSVSFYMNEYSSGFYKNYITVKNGRLNSVISKILIQAIFTFSILSVMVISDLVGRGIFFGNAEIGDLAYFIKLLIGQFLLHWAFSILILCVAILTRSMLISLIIGIVLGLNVIGMMLGALESMIDNLNVTPYLLVNTIAGSIDYNSISGLIHVLGVALVILLLFTFVAITYKMKEDLI